MRNLIAMSRVRRGALGVVTGALLAVAGLWLGSGDSPDVGAPSTNAAVRDSSVPEPEWLPGGGIRFSSTVIQPDPIEIGDGTASFAYRLLSLGAPDGSLPAVLPDVWTLRLGDGSVFEATTPPPRPANGESAAPLSASARFTDLPATATRADVAEVAVTRWRVAVPIRTEFEIASQPGSTFRFDDGTTVTLATVIEQKSGSILDFDVTAAPDAWREVVRNPFGRITTYQGAGRGWVSASSTIGGTGLSGGSTGFQLRWSELEVPDPVRIIYTAVTWGPLEATVLISAGDDG